MTIIHVKHRDNWSRCLAVIMRQKLIQMSSTKTKNETSLRSVLEAAGYEPTDVVGSQFRWSAKNVK